MQRTLQYMDCPIFIHLILSMVLGASLCTEVNPLNGQHLRVLACEFPLSLVTKRNATGHVIYIEGGLKYLMESLSQMFNFSYSYLPVVATHFEDSPTEKGSSYYLIHDEADFSLSTTIAIPSRLPKVDFPASWFFSTFSTLIPYPEQESLNLAASFKPLSYQVWILVSVAAFGTMLFLGLLQKRKFLPVLNCPSKIKDDVNTKGTHRSVVLYVMGNLVSIGQHFFSKRLSTRIAAGAWCCGCFFLVQIYCSTLTSHLTTPIQKPIVNSFFEIADTPGIILTLEREFAIDAILQALSTIKTIMDIDLKITERCQYSMTKEIFWDSAVFTPLRKNSPYTKTISKGILRLQETGFLNEWEKWYVPLPSKCMELNQRIEKPQLSIKHLSSAFVILIVGYIISTVVFVVEKMRIFYVDESWLFNI